MENLSTDNMIILCVMIIYLVLLFANAIYFNMKNEDERDYLQGSKKIPGWVLAISERATSESVYLLIGCTGYCYIIGVNSFFFLGSCIVGLAIAWFVVGKKVRQDNEKYNAMTLTGYLAAKFKERGNTIIWALSLSIIIFYTFYLTTQFSGAGKTLLAILGLDAKTGMILSALIVGLYTMIGGFRSVVWTDMVQGILMLIALVVVPIVGYIDCMSRGIDPFQVIANANVDGVALGTFFGGDDFTAMFLMALANFSWFFTYLGGQPALMGRMMNIRSEKEYMQASYIAIIWAIVAFGGACMIGIVGNGYFGVDALKDREMLLPLLMTELLSPVLVGLLIAAIISAMISSADSVVLVMASSAVEDIAFTALNIKMTSKQKIQYSRILIGVFCLLGLWVGFHTNDFIQVVVSWMSAGIGANFSAALILALFDKKCSSMGIATGIFVGIVTTIIWMTTPLETYVSARMTTFFWVLIAGAIASRLFPDKELRPAT